MNYQDEQTKVANLLETVALSHGLGTEAEPCTVAAVNLALTGTLTDKRPDCVCPVLHAWVIPVQDAMPLALLNAPEWLALVPLLAGSVSTPEMEQARAERILSWTWDRLGDEAVLAAVPEAARPAWDRMLTERTGAAAGNAWDAARAAAGNAWDAARAAAGNARDAARAAAGNAREAARAAAGNAREAAGAADAAEAAGEAAGAADAAEAAREAAGAADAAEAARAAYWSRANPAGLLAELLAMREAA